MPSLVPLRLSYVTNQDNEKLLMVPISIAEIIYPMAFCEFL